MRLLYLSPVPWESFSQRPHKFVEWFQNRTGGLVLWVDPYPTRFPNWKDLWHARPSVKTTQKNNTPPWLTVLKPWGLPIEPLPGSGLINMRLWHCQLKQITDFANHSKTWLAIGKPSIFALELLKLLQHCPSLYDAMDDFPTFYTGLSGIALARREREIARQVDVIWASSSKLKSQWEHINSNVCLVHNGLDLSAIKEAELMSKSSKNGIFGYTGTIASWFDWNWVYNLSKVRPNNEIRLIGPVFERPPSKLPNNVKLLPACNHAAALKAMMQFHVGLIPFKINKLTASVDPIKYYEYRALGLPIISTNFGEMSLRSDNAGVFISRSTNDLTNIATSAIQFRHDTEITQKFAQQNTWEARFDAAKFLN